VTDDLKVLKKPIHAAIFRPTHIRKLHDAGKLPKSAVSLEVPSDLVLPKERKVSSIPKFNPLKGFNSKNVVKQEYAKARLKIYYNNLPAMPEELTPPCSSCKTKICCSVFVISLSQEEHESGFYDPYSIKLVPEVVCQLQSRLLLPTTVRATVYNSSEDRPHYLLEGILDEPCPFQAENGLCSIYETRPEVCRTYTCIGDDRITQEMRDGND